MIQAPRTPMVPYDLSTGPSSSGRALLARAFAHYCALHWGLDETDTAAALVEDGDSPDAKRVRAAAQLLGRVFAEGHARTFARPFGGGPAIPLNPEHWELDDFRMRFAESALNLRQPWNVSAEPTHWVFVDADDWDAIAEASCVDVPRPRRKPTEPAVAWETVTGAAEPVGSGDVAQPRDLLRLVRMPEVKARTGLARSTIYKKVRNGSFPEPATTGSFLAWREAAVDDWLADPR